MANEPVDAVPVTQRGRVKLFSLERGYGFVKPDGGGPDLYILRANIEKPKGFLRVGDYVCFQVIKTDKGPQVMHIRAIKDDGSEVADDDVPDSKGKETVDAILSKARELALKAVSDKLATGAADAELEEKHRRMSARVESERKERLQRMLAQAEEGKKAAEAALAPPQEPDSESDSEEAQASFASLALPTGSGGVVDEASLEAARDVLMKRHSLDMRATSGPTAITRERIEEKILAESQRVRKYETKLANIRRGLDELKGLHRALSAAQSSREQTALNFSQAPQDHTVNATSLALQPVYITTSSAGGPARAVVPVTSPNGAPKSKHLTSGHYPSTVVEGPRDHDPTNVRHTVSAQPPPPHRATKTSPQPQPHTVKAPREMGLTTAPPLPPCEFDIDVVAISATAAQTAMRTLGGNGKQGKVVADAGFKMDLSFLDTLDDDNPVIREAVAAAAARRR